jgi:hypothetical protein
MKRIILVIGTALLIKISLVFVIATVLSGHRKSSENSYTASKNKEKSPEKKCTVSLRIWDGIIMPGFSSLTGVRPTNAHDD